MRACGYFFFRCSDNSFLFLSKRWTIAVRRQQHFQTIFFKKAKTSVLYSTLTNFHPSQFPL